VRAVAASRSAARTILRACRQNGAGVESACPPTARVRR
jgi:hypothetical protein